MSAIAQRSVARTAEVEPILPTLARLGQTSVGVALLGGDFTVRVMNAALARLIACAGVEDAQRETDGLVIVRSFGFDRAAILAELASHGLWQGTAMVAGLDDPAVREVHLGVESVQEPNCNTGWLITAREQAEQKPAPLTEQQLIALSAKLTPRECQVMLALHEGASNKAIALRLEISPRTVEFHRARIMQRFDAKSVVDLVRKVTSEVRAAN